MRTLHRVRNGGRPRCMDHHVGLPLCQQIRERRTRQLHLDVSRRLSQWVPVRPCSGKPDSQNRVAGIKKLRNKMAAEEAEGTRDQTDSRRNGSHNAARLRDTLLAQRR